MKALPYPDALTPLPSPTKYVQQYRYNLFVVTENVAACKLYIFRDREVRRVAAAQTHRMALNPHSMILIS